MDLTWLCFIEGKNAPDVMILNSQTLLSGRFYCSRVTAVSIFKFISESETTSMPNAIRILNVMLTHGGQVHCSSSSQNSPQSSALSFRLSHHLYLLTIQRTWRESDRVFVSLYLNKDFKSGENIFFHSVCTDWISVECITGCGS